MASKINKPERLSECVIFGNACELSDTVLPTYSDVMKHYLYERRILKRNSNKDPSVSDISNVISRKLKDIWIKSSIPSVSQERVKKMIVDYHHKYRALLKHMKGRKESVPFKKKVDEFRSKAESTLFDISACKCRSFTDCDCERMRKVPKEEQLFLNDQRTTRKMAIGGVDTKSTKKKAELVDRKRKRQSYMERASSTSKEQLSLTETDSSETSSAESEVSKDPTYREPRSMKPTTIKVKKVKSLEYSQLASACDRTGVSDRAAAIIASSVLHDNARCSETNPALVVDRSKLRRTRRKHRDFLNEKQTTECQTVVGLYFDGRKDATLKQIEVGGKLIKKTVQEEHISIIKEPGSTYLGHISVKTGSAQAIANGLHDFITEKGVPTEGIKAIGCDGTAVNTGVKGGAIRLLELKLNKPVHWFSCQLHANELPLRHLIQNLDGKTSGPRSYTGDIGKKLEECETLDIVDFHSIPTSIPAINQADLSTDQKYLYNIVTSISNGVLRPGLQSMNPGKLAHSRWLTTANRILRLYVSTEEPSATLVTITEFIMKAYAPMWFSIKFSSSSQSGPHHLFKTIQLTRNCSSEVINIVDPVIQRNAFYAHPENMLLSMINDAEGSTRELGWRRIKKARAEDKGKTVRTFRIPKLNFSATRYIDMINWIEEKVTEPPLTRGISDAELDFMIESRAQKEFPNLPCHTQAVERCVKLVTEASSLVCSEQARHGLILSRIKSRQKMPKFETKRQFVR